MENYNLTLEDFKNSGWQQAIYKCDYMSYDWRFAENFVKIANSAIDNGDTKSHKILTLLKNACSLVFSKNCDTLSAALVFSNGEMSFNLNNFSDEDIGFFKLIVPKITDYRLKARIADVIWCYKHNGNHEFALIAIDEYFKFLSIIKSDEWMGCLKEIERLVHLCKELKQNDKLKKLYEWLFDYFISIPIDIGHPHDGKILHIARLIKGIKSSREKFFIKLKEFMSYQLDSSLFYELYFELIKSFSPYSKDDVRHWEIYDSCAKAYLKDADKRNHYYGKSIFINKAIKIYEDIPNKFRDRYISSHEYERLKDKYNECCQAVITEGVTISTQIDLTENIIETFRSMKNKTKEEAIKQFAVIEDIADYSDLEKHANDTLAKPLLYQCIKCDIFNGIGQKVWQVPALDIENMSENELHDWKLAQMLERHRFNMNVAVNGSILPALQILNTEHEITLEDIKKICSLSLIIPEGRCLFWAKGLYLGFQKDFISAISILVPQIEHLVRVELNKHGISTTHVDKDGCNTEKGLGSLLADDENMKRIFGDDIFFELLALLDIKGKNFRNEAAHGLLTVEKANSSCAIYLWWFAFSVVYVSYRYACSGLKKK